jgi:hypothetical protein
MPTTTLNSHQRMYPGLRPDQHFFGDEVGAAVTSSGTPRRLPGREEMEITTDGPDLPGRVPAC